MNRDSGGDGGFARTVRRSLRRSLKRLKNRSDGGKEVDSGGGGGSGAKWQSDAEKNDSNKVLQIANRVLSVEKGTGPKKVWGLGSRPVEG